MRTRSTMRSLGRSAPRVAALALCVGAWAGLPAACSAAEAAACDAPPPRRVLLFGHGRSGTTFLSEPFRAHPGFWFLYEPLRAFAVDQRRRRRRRQLQGQGGGGDETPSAGLMPLARRMLRCDFDDAMLKILRRDGSTLHMRCVALIQSALQHSILRI